MKKTQLHFLDHLPRRFDFSNSILIYDNIFKQNKILNKKFGKWISRFEKSLPVNSGEKLKSLDDFSRYILHILKYSEGLSKEKLTLVALGGGSVGDFTGFVASVLKRGIRLIHIPSTWLSAMDSSHGGKTALNIGKIKNQIGTFYPADEIFLVRDLLLSQGLERAHEGLGEFYKMALIDGGKFYRQAGSNLNPTPLFLWNMLPIVIRAKLKIVEQDPFERKGMRHVLNLGHTVGHVIESELDLPHGLAVSYGLRFAINWGEKLGMLKQTRGKKIEIPEHFFPSSDELALVLRKIKDPIGKILSDKKVLSPKTIRFVFVKYPGRVVVHPVSLKSLEQEWKRQAQ